MNTYNMDKMYENYSSEVERMQKCIDELQQENKSLKEVIDKAIEYIEELNKMMPRFWFTKLLDILKEVE